MGYDLPSLWDCPGTNPIVSLVSEPVWRKLGLAYLWPNRHALGDMLKKTLHILVLLAALVSVTGLQAQSPPQTPRPETEADKKPTVTAAEKAEMNGLAESADKLFMDYKFAEAEQVYRSLLKLKQRVLGAEHPRTWQIRMEISYMLDFQQKYKEAEQELRTVLEIETRVLGAEHPDTLRTRSIRAIMLHLAGQVAEAEQEHRRVLTVSERVLGAEHPETLSSRNHLAEVLLAQGKNAEAEQEYRTQLKIEERTQKAEDYGVFYTCRDLALCLEAQRKLKEAQKLAQRAEDGLNKASRTDDDDYIKVKQLNQRLKTNQEKQKLNQTPKQPNQDPQ